MSESHSGLRAAAKSSHAAKVGRMKIGGGPGAETAKNDDGSTKVKPSAMAKTSASMTVEGRSTPKRLDRYARGGRTKGGATTVNINMPGGGAAAPIAPPMPVVPPAALAALAAPKPAMPVPPPTPSGPMMPPGGAMPPGAPAGLPMRKRGGRVMSAGSGSGEGREEKAEMARRDTKKVGK